MQVYEQLSKGSWIFVYGPSQERNYIEVGLSPPAFDQCQPRWRAVDLVGDLFPAQLELLPAFTDHLGEWVAHMVMIARITDCVNRACRCFGTTRGLPCGEHASPVRIPARTPEVSAICRAGGPYARKNSNGLGPHAPAS